MEVTSASKLGLLLIVTVYCIDAEPTGAPSSACSMMTPAHYGQKAQSGVSPFVIESSSGKYCPNVAITVTLKGSSSIEKFRGFLCQARTEKDTYATIGRLALEDTSNGKNVCDMKALTHKGRDEKQSVGMKWTPDDMNTDPVYIVCTIVKQFDTFWVKQNTSAITFAGADVCNPPEKQGYCPAVSPGVVGTCVEHCSADAGCSGDQKCCSNGCGHTCQDPTICRNGTSLEGVFCGRGPTRQDCPQTHYCEIAPDDRYAVCCRKEDGACYMNEDCATNATCVKGMCKPISKPGICPAATGFGICVEACSDDFNCTGDHKCCSNGCGHTCQEPMNPCSEGRPLQRPAFCGRGPGSEECPNNYYCEISAVDKYAVCCQTRVDTCSSDLDCAGMTDTSCIGGKCTVSGAMESTAMSIGLLLGCIWFLIQL